ncbi:GPW/gp25 family protein [Bosea sp. MMO-172]|uniref:GPW/gp25 family protein n=1 Tax=Bosea sp. MMO-172 TaxID=3127885 RepID=UPI00301819FB
MPDGNGLDRRTLKRISGWAHVQQSIEVILTTPLGSRVMRRDFGSALFDLIDAKMTQRRVLALYAAAAIAIARWEPRFRLTRCSMFTGDGRLVRLGPTGKISIELHGNYYPRGHLGDFSIVEDATVRVVRPS